MASENETVADIVKEKRDTADEEELKGKNTLAFDLAKMLREEADRIESAHKREIAAKDDERLTIVANYENVIAAKDREIAELRECLKEAYRLQLRCDSCKIRKCDSICMLKLKWRNALKGSNNATK